MTPASSCPACHGENLLPLETVRLADQHPDYTPDKVVQKHLTALAEVPGDTYRMLRCGDCGLEFADPLKAPTSKWYDLVYSVLSLYPGSRWEFEHTLASLRPSDLLGELGCGSGEFLRKCADRGIKAAGVDFSQSAIDACVKTSLDARLLDVSMQTPEFMSRGDRDVVVAFQVLEHVDQPGSLFALARGWARRGGKLLVAVPSDRRPSRYFDERDYLDQPPHHMSRWTEKSLRILGREQGWRLHDVSYEPLAFRTKVWWFSTRIGLYKKFLKLGLFRHGFVERIFRHGLLPVAVVRVLASTRPIAGQSMLATYEKV